MLLRTLWVLAATMWLFYIATCAIPSTPQLPKYVAPEGEAYEMQLHWSNQ